MSNLPLFNFPAFHEAANQLRAVGYTVVSTAEGCDDTPRPWEYYMRQAIPVLLGCEAVAVLPGWQQSRGATLEVTIALSLGMRVLPVQLWVDEAAKE